MRISRELADKIAENALEDRKKAADDANTHFKDKTYLAILPFIPATIKDLMKGPNSRYIKTTTGFQLSAEGLAQDYTYFYTDRKIPIESGAHETYRIKVSTEVHNMLMDFHRTYEGIRKSYNDDLKKLKAAIFELRTVKKVGEVFPELIPFLPSNSTALTTTVNVSEIKQILGTK